MNVYVIGVSRLRFAMLLLSFVACMLADLAWVCQGRRFFACLLDSGLLKYD